MVERERVSDEYTELVADVRAALERWWAERVEPSPRLRRLLIEGRGQTPGLRRLRRPAPARPVESRR